MPFLFLFLINAFLASLIESNDRSCAAQSIELEDRDGGAVMLRLWSLNCKGIILSAQHS